MFNLLNRPIAFFIKGLSGSGKPTLAQQLVETEYAIDTSETVKCAIHETDSFFVGEDGSYNFDPSRLGEYHAKNLEAFKESIDNAVQVVINSNTNTQYWEFAQYLDYAVQAGYVTIIIDLHDGGCTNAQLDKRNKHGFPLDKFDIVREHYERAYDGADARPPWERG